MKINNLRSQGLEYLKQVKKTLWSKRQSQKELLLWDPTPRATSQVTQCWLCEHSRQACPSVKEMGLICNFLSPPQIFRWTCFLTYLKVRGKIREYKLTSIVSLLDKKNQGSPFKVEKSVRVQTTSMDKGPQSSWKSFSWVQQALAHVPSRWTAATPPKPNKDRPSGQVWRGEATLMETRGLITVTNIFCPVPAKMQ